MECPNAHGIVLERLRVTAATERPRFAAVDLDLDNLLDMTFGSASVIRPTSIPASRTKIESTPTTTFRPNDRAKEFIMGIEAFRYDGKRTLIVGGATGMGAAVAKTVADLGGETIVMDVAEITYPVKQSIQVNLTDRASVDAALAQVEGNIDAVFCCAGVADGTPGLMLINFTSQRHIIDALIASGQLPRGAAIAMIASVAGMGWQMNLEKLGEFLDTPDWDAAASWIASHDDTDTYAFSKQAMNAYIARKGMSLLEKGIRINGIEPGPTDTPLARANADLWLTFAQDYRDKVGVPHLTPQQMAEPLIYLCSDAASGINGISILVDQGHVSSGVVGNIDFPSLTAD
jgi:NAD(P)-dependent dehydrogenase (short-subunit alcohol dehydrogenase family)